MPTSKPISIRSSAAVRSSPTSKPRIKNLDGHNAPHWAGRGTFALQVRGDSMVNPAGMPSFPAGCIIIVDPTREAEDGDAVIAKFAGADEPVFKMLQMYEGEKYLKPLNSHSAPEAWPDDARLVGVVISMTYDLVPAPRSAVQL